MAAGELAAKQGDVVEARRQFKAALQMTPDHFGTLLAFGTFEYQQNNPSVAAEYLERANKPTVRCNASELLLRVYTLIGETGKANELKARLEKGLLLQFERRVL